MLGGYTREDLKRLNLEQKLLSETHEDYATMRIKPKKGAKLKSEKVCVLYVCVCVCESGFITLKMDSTSSFSSKLFFTSDCHSKYHRTCYHVVIHIIIIQILQDLEDAFLEKAITAISHVCDFTDAFAWGPQDSLKSKKKSQRNRSWTGVGGL